MLLSFKAGFFVVENTQFLHQSEICCEVNLTDFENDNEEKKEVDESEKIHQIVVYTNFSSNIPSEKNQSKRTTRCLNILYEFTTPPPELV